MALATEFKQQNHVFEYENAHIPAYVFENNDQIIALTHWMPNAEEIKAINEGSGLWVASRVYAPIKMNTQSPYDK